MPKLHYLNLILKIIRKKLYNCEAFFQKSFCIQNSCGHEKWRLETCLRVKKLWPSPVSVQAHGVFRLQCPTASHGSLLGTCLRCGQVGWVPGHPSTLGSWQGSGLGDTGLEVPPVLLSNTGIECERDQVKIWTGCKRRNKEKVIA